MSEYLYVPLYYHSPTYVRYYDPTSKDFHYGIAYHDQICTHNGNVMPITTCIIEAQCMGIHWDDAIIEQVWLELDYI